MVPIGRTVLRQACEDIALWQRTSAAHAHLAVTVNLSPSELQNPKVADEVEAILARTRIEPQLAHARDHRERRHARPASRLSRPSTCSAGSACASRSTTSAPATRRSATCASSRSTSSRSRSRSWTTSEPRRPTRRFLEAILGLARALDLTVVVEGIETADQAATLHRLGCGLGQGYHFARPLDRAAAATHLADAAPGRRLTAA